MKQQKLMNSKDCLTEACMGKDKKTYKFLSKVKENYDKEIRQRMSEDVFAILHNEDTQNDKYNQCWMSGFQYAFERIKTIFELKRN